MARSKALLFPTEQRIVANFGLAMAHPVRVELLRRLLSVSPLSYTLLLRDIPLSPSTMHQHLTLLVRAGFLIDQVLSDGEVGYGLDRVAFNAAHLAYGRQLGGAGALVRYIGIEEDGEVA